ncbi:PaaI family thioesterase [Nocardia sp. NPDC057227]|uniref:PaaI family thioesterase n=1 Tax=Nocardia sp. NPDC057227 TaxID=3346056 RepID=UPI0036341D1D
MTSLEAIGDLMNRIGFRRDSIDGATVWELPVAPHVVNISGGLQGGLTATLIDIAAGSAAIESRPPGTGVVTSDLNIRYLRAITSGVARAQARIVHSGARSTVVEVEVRSEPDGVVAVIATANFAHVGFPGMGEPPTAD